MPATSKAVWRGTLKEGDGTMVVGDGRYEGPFTYMSRFENGEGSNPEELIGAAHAGCFSMFLSALLGKKDYTPIEIRTTATVHISAGTISKIELNCVANVPGLSDAELQELAAEAKAGCPVSKALAAVEEVVLVAKLA